MNEWHVQGQLYNFTVQLFVIKQKSFGNMQILKHWMFWNSQQKKSVVWNMGFVSVKLFLLKSGKINVYH